MRTPSFMTLGAVLLAFAGCRPSPAPPSPSDFLDPTTAESSDRPNGESGATPGSAVDFSWWAGDRDVVAHPISEDIDDEFWRDWEGRPNRIASDPASSREEIREALERFGATPGIFGGLWPPAEELETRAQAHGASDTRLYEDQWIVLGQPFNRDVVHVFQVPIHPRTDEQTPQYTYETEEFVFAAIRGHVDVIFAPDAVRAGETGVIPDAFVPLFETTSERLTYTTMDITFLYPRYRETIVREYVVANWGNSMVRKFHPADAENTLSFLEEAARD